LKKIIKYGIDFKRKCRSETIIIHLKKKYIDIKVNTSDEKKKKEQIINEKISISIEEVCNSIIKKRYIIKIIFIFQKKKKMMMMIILIKIYQLLVN